VKASVVDEVNGAYGSEGFVVAIEDELVWSGDGETELDALTDELGRDLVEEAIDFDGCVLADDASDASEKGEVDLMRSESLDEG
jgi:hypothetical protein